MRPNISYRTLTAICLVCLWAMVCLQWGAFIPTVAAQEAGTEATSIPTPTTAPTWTPTSVGPTPTTASGTPTPTGRIVDFRADAHKIDLGGCTTFSWIVRGDFLTVEFDARDDNKSAVLVSEEEYDHEECPSKTTRYYLIVHWLDGTQETKTIKVEVRGTSSGDSGSSDSGGTSGTPAAGGSGSFVAVSPIPIPGIGGAAPAATPQPVAIQSTPGGTVVTPVGELGSVQILPETGYSPLPAEDEAPSAGGFIPAMAGGGLGMAGIGLILLVKLTQRSKESR